MSSLDGYVLGKYEIIEEIGRGGMANVYRAIQRSIGREVAIKVLPAHIMRDPTFLERFHLEVRTIARLEHPRILPVHDFGEEDDMPYIVMRYMPAGTLADRIYRNPDPIPLADAVTVIVQISEALDFAHKKGIVHRDFKPANILLDSEGNAYLADFGIAKVAEAKMQLTGSGVIGTPAYLAPEMLEVGRTSPLIDIYAMGVTFYEMLTKRLPYDAESPMQMLMAHLEQPIPYINSLRDDLPQSLQRIINGMLAKDPYDRYQSASAVADDLRALLDPGEVPTPSGLPAVMVEDDEDTGYFTQEEFRQTIPADTLIEQSQLKALLAHVSAPEFVASVKSDRAVEKWPGRPPSKDSVFAALEKVFPIPVQAAKTIPDAAAPAVILPPAQDAPAYIPCPVCSTENPMRERHCIICGASLPRDANGDTTRAAPLPKGPEMTMQFSRIRMEQQKNVVKGSKAKVCADCGADNSRLRRKCSQCGKPLA